MHRLTETMLTIPNSNRKHLQAILCGHSHHSTCVVMCYPFADERKYAQPTFVQLARELSQQSVSSLRFDYAGCGNSEGSFREASFREWIDDCGLMFALVRDKGYNNVIGMGLRLGANIAWEAARTSAICDGIILWNYLEDVASILSTGEKRSAILRMFRKVDPAKTDFEKDHGLALDYTGYGISKGMAHELTNAVPISRTALSRAESVRICELGPHCGVSRPVPVAPPARGVLRVCGRPFWSLPNIVGNDTFCQATRVMIEDLSNV